MQGIKELRDQPPTTIATDYIDLVASITKWKSSKQFGQTTTYSQWIDGLFWVARRSVHQQPSFEAFKNALFHNHTQQESEYIHMITSYVQLDATAPWESYRAEYKLPFPLRKREFVFWILCQELNDHEFIVLSIPRAYDSDMVRGKYISIEHAKKLADGSVEWRMATTSDAGGVLPQWLQRQSLEKTIANDVESVLEYIHKK